ncbi:restriction endonuclease subunit S [Janibacter sp. RAF52]|uniref:restriction endonuclease subunit S n=1 Tax=unclassified Janibacter TaxID=2649294 RepID=UPI003F8E0105
MRLLSLGESLDALIDHRGKTPKKLGSEFTDSGIPVASAMLVTNGVLDLSGARHVSTETYRKWMPVPLKRGDVLLTSEAPLGRVARLRTDAPLVLGQRLYGLRGREGVLDTHFLYYALQSEQVQADLQGRSTGSTVFGIRQSALRKVAIPAPSFPEQRAIAEVLGALDEKIAVNARLSACAEELVIALAGQGKAQCKLADVATRTTRTVKPEALSEAEVDHFSLPAYDESRTPEATLAPLIKSAKFAIESPCVLLSKLNPRIPRVWDVVELSGRPSLASTEFIVLQPELVCSSVLWAVLSQQNFMVELKSMVAGTSGSHQRVRPDDVMTLEITDPRSLSKATQEAITALGRTVVHARLENEKLARTRDALLPLLMSGKVTVKDAEAMVGEVV